MISLLMIITLYFSGNLYGQGDQDKIVVDLNGSWSMEGALPGQGIVKMFHKIQPDGGNGRVPGDVYTDLWKQGRIEDPYVGQNSQRAKWVMDREWWYFKRVNVPREMIGKQIRINFEGVDYECDVWFNGEYLGNHQGMYSRFSFDVTHLLKPTTEGDRRGGNFLAVRLAPPPQAFALVTGRKYRWHGDYGTNVTPFGIWRPVWLEATGPVSIKDTWVKTDVQKNGSAKLDVQVELFNNSYSKRNIKIDVKVKGENFESRTYSVSVNKVSEPGETTYNIPLEINDPKLWYPFDLGDQNLYEAAVSISEGSDFQDREKTSFGIRKLEMAMNPGWTLDQVEYPWTPMINGKRHYMRSACWGGPPDMFVGRSTEERYREYIRLAKEANINNLRIFCWHPIEIPLFYKLCDEAGITVWTDLSLSGNSPRDRKEVQAIFDESIDIVKKLRNNPSMIFLSGGEEVLYGRNRSENDWSLQLITELGRVLDPYHEWQWVPTCPLSYPNLQGVFKPKESIHAHTPHYGAGSVMLEDYYPSLDYAYIPELAITSCPNVESIKKFIPEDELWPPGPSWGYRWADLDILRIHNWEILGDQMTDDFEDFVEATQISQGVYFQFATETYRIRKPKMSGMALCHFMLNTPDMKWAIVDYYLQPKISHEYVKRANQPLLVCLEHNKRRWNPGETFKGNVWIVNDYYEDYSNCTVEVKFMDKNKKVVKEENLKVGNVDGDLAKKFSEVSLKVPGEKGDKFYVEMRLLDKDGKSISENEYFLLVDDQEEAKKFMKLMGEDARARSRTGGGTVRYFPEIMGDRFVPVKYIEDFK
ncbi:glycoside hydrolase family 2 protein [Bacteroidota bacterium]